MKIYFQVQGGRKLRVYKIAEANEPSKKRAQETLAVLSADDNIPDALLMNLSEDDRMRLADTLDLLRHQVEYERVRDALVKLPPLVNKASELLAANRLRLSAEQKNEMRNALTAFLKHLK